MAVQFPGRPVTAIGRREQHPVIGLLRHLDFVLIGSAILLSLIGVVMVYSATKVLLQAQGIDPHYYLKRQIVWLVVGLVVLVVTIAVDYQFLAQFGYVFYGLVLLSLVAVLSRSIGSSALGSQRWIQFGPLQIQPSEFAALALIIVVATYCSRLDVIEPRHLFVVSALAGVPILLVAKQPDLGTAIIMAIVLVAMLVSAGVRLRYLAVMAIVGVVGVYLAVHLGIVHSYQIGRLTNFLNQGSGTQSGNYNLNQSKIAIASGGLTGTGPFRGAATNGGYVPEQQTDFIFTAVGEQFGFAGAAVVISLFGIVALRILRAAQIARDPFGRMICAGGLAFIAFSAFQNMAMTVGLMPITGIPLPFVSYGGSALIVFFATVGLVVNVEMRRLARR